MGAVLIFVVFPDKIFISNRTAFFYLFWYAAYHFSVPITVAGAEGNRVWPRHCPSRHQ